MLTARAIARAVIARETSAIDLFEGIVERIGALNPRLNAISRFEPALGRAAAMAADARAARGDAAALLGVPFVVEDRLWIEGQGAAHGPAPEEAVPVARLRAAGAVLVGAANGPAPVAAGRGGGPTCNPWDLERMPGDCSGGAASAVAAGLTTVGLAVDEAGSARHAAARVGVVAVKPSGGVVPNPVGPVDPVPGEAVVTPVTRSVEDAALVLDALAGMDGRDPRSIALPRRFHEAVADPEVRGLRVAYSTGLGPCRAVDPGVVQAVEQAVQGIERARVGVARVEATGLTGAGEAGDDAGQEVLRLAGLAAVHGERYRAAPERFEPEAARRIEAGLALSGADVIRALQAREAAYRATAAFFERFDLLVLPTVGSTAALGRPHDRAALPFDHAALPACTVPCGRDARGLPVGLHIIGRRLRDADVLRLAVVVEAHSARLVGTPPGFATAF